MSMTGIAFSAAMNQFSREQLEAINMILNLLDPDEFRDYHDQFGVCNAPDTIEQLRNGVKNALEQIQN
jgi:hypothetical protein